MSEATVLCCETMRTQLFHRCAKHPDPYDCPDALIVFYPSGNVGIPIRDGGSSYSKIEYCPWCGTKLPIIDMSETPPRGPT